RRLAEHLGPSRRVAADVRQATPNLLVPADLVGELLARLFTLRSNAQACRPHCVRPPALVEVLPSQMQKPVFPQRAPTLTHAARPAAAAPAPEVGRPAPGSGRGPAAGRGPAGAPGSARGTASAPATGLAAPRAMGPRGSSATGLGSGSGAWSRPPGGFPSQSECRSRPSPRTPRTPARSTSPAATRRRSCPPTRR